MRIAIMQPYFMPYLGYFQLIHAVDKFVVYDNVSYIKGGWINRNYILLHGEKKLFTMKLSNSGSNILINQIQILDNLKSWLKTIRFNYCNAPQFNYVFPMLESIAAFENKNLALFITNSLKKICDYLSINTSFLIASEIDMDSHLKGEKRVIMIAKLLGATQYINASGGKHLYDRTAFESENITLNFIESKLSQYPQHTTSSFVPGLSIIDLLMNCHPDEIRPMLSNFELV